MWSCVIFLVDTVALLLGVGVYSKNRSFQSLIGCSGSMDPPCLRSRNSWRIRRNWDSNARPDLLAVGVGCCRRKELLRGISNLCMGWWGNAKFPDVSWYFLHVHQKMFVHNFQVVLAVSVIPLHCFWWLLHGFPLSLTPWRKKSEVELRKYCCPILQCLMDEPVVAEAWALRFIHFTANGRLQLNTQKKTRNTGWWHFSPWWPPTMRLKMNSGMMVNSIAYCNGWSIWRMSWS